jgi:hypothetical protein
MDDAFIVTAIHQLFYELIFLFLHGIAGRWLQKI